MRCNILLVLCLMSAWGCSSNKSKTDRALWERPSQPAFLSPGAPPKAPLAAIDRDLSREVWSSDYRAVVTPLTIPLITRMVVLDCERVSCKSEQQRIIIEKLSRKFAAQKSCFYFFVSDTATSPHEAKGMQYFLSYATEKGVPQPALRPLSEERTKAEYKVQSKLLERYLPHGSQSQLRNTLGFVGANAEIVCGNQIDFRKPFSFRIAPQGEENETALLKWTDRSSE